MEKFASLSADESLLEEFVYLFCFVPSSLSLILFSVNQRYAPLHYDVSKYFHLILNFGFDAFSAYACTYSIWTAA